MKTITSLMIAFGLSIFASSVFAVMRPPYPQKTTAPYTIIITDERNHDAIRSTARRAK